MPNKVSIFGSLLNDWATVWLVVGDLENGGQAAVDNVGLFLRWAKKVGC